MYPKITFSSLLLALLLWSGCSTSHISMDVLRPAQITLPQEVKNLALVNRFRPEKGKGFLNVLEGALSGENINQDRNGAEASLRGLTNTLAGSPRFRIVRPATELQGWGRASFPEPLAPGLVKQICRDYNSDALVTIEAFDSDHNRRCEQRTRTVKRDGQSIKEIFFVAQQWIDVTVGWRLYSAETGTLIDEYRMQERVSFDANGPSEAVAFRNLPNSDFMVREMGRVTGEAYSFRISPLYVRVSRDYYSRGTTALQLGKRKVRMNDWEGAEKHWDMALTNEKEKIRGRALFNKALAQEVQGNLIEAHNIAARAYEEYGNKRARRYAQVLQQRIYDNDILNEQMKGAE